MKSLIFTLITILFASPVFATVDGMTDVWIVVENIQDESDMFLKKVPVVGCYGLSQGPQLAQFTAEYKVPNVGCGGTTHLENINALSCANLVSSKEGDDYSSFKKITLDISKCKQKTNARFITLVRTAAARNFPQTQNGKVIEGAEVELILKK